MRNDGVVLNVGEGGFVNAGRVSVDAGQGLMYSLSK